MNARLEFLRAPFCAYAPNQGCKLPPGLSNLGEQLGQFVFVLGKLCEGTQDFVFAFRSRGGTCASGRRFKRRA
jgi:hypothetical protein